MPGSHNANPAEGGGKDEASADELPIGMILAGKYKLTELAHSHPVLGLTYNAINQQGDGFIVRVDSEKYPLSLVRLEGGFLQEVLKHNKCDHFVQIMHGAKYQRIIYFVTRFRPGPTLNQCLGAAPQGKFSVGTATRCAYNILKAIEVVHSLNYLMRRMDPNVIRFDAHTRSIFISDASSVRLNLAQVKINAPVRWAGAQIYAPLQHHEGGNVAARHDIEGLIYLLVDMTTATLPWEASMPETMGSVKRQSITDKSLFNGCPAQYTTIHTYITGLGDSDKIDYDRIYKKLEEAWKQAGVKDAAKEKYDWETLMRAPDANGY